MIVQLYPRYASLELLLDYKHFSVDGKQVFSICVLMECSFSSIDTVKGVCTCPTGSCAQLRHAT